ncbi:MAG: two-component system sensor histidine kinase NtrB [Candidatus Sumerlaeia bacterium]
MGINALSPKKVFRRSAPFYLALLLLLISLCVALAGGWVLYSLFREAKEDELNNRLFAIGQAAETGLVSNEAAEITMLLLLQAAEEESLPESDSEWRAWFDLLTNAGTDLEELRNQLAQLKTSAHLTSLMMLSPQKRIIVDADNQYTPGDQAPLANVDEYAIEAALDGENASIPFYVYEDVPHKRVYVPLKLPVLGEGDGGEEYRTGALLRLEASFEALSEVTNLRRQVLIVAAIVSLTMLTAALVFHRLIRLFVRIEESAAHRDRLQAMGLLTAGIAHEVRNPLGIIRTVAEALADDYEPGDSGREMIDDIVGEVERLNQLVNQYLAFARPDMASETEEADPTEVLSSVAKLVEKGDRDHIALHLKVDADLPRVAMNPPALKQVLLNLVMNAREASPPDEPVEIQASHNKSRNTVEVHIRDHGAGIPQRRLKRIFDPFYTTKVQGSGLGLPICRYLVEERDGTISLESETGKGATARISLPVLRSLSGERKEK